MLYLQILFFFSLSFESGSFGYRYGLIFFFDMDDEVDYKMDGGQVFWTLTFSLCGKPDDYYLRLGFFCMSIRLSDEKRRHGKRP